MASVMTRDPQGAAIAIFWNALMTGDAAAAFRFYSDLFGWKVVEDPQGAAFALHQAATR